MHFNFLKNKNRIISLITVFVIMFTVVCFDFVTFANSYSLRSYTETSNSSMDADGGKTVKADVSEAYKNWKQYDNPWGQLRLCRKAMRAGGCRVTVLSMLLVKSGCKNEGEFSPLDGLILFKRSGVVNGNGDMVETNMGNAKAGLAYGGTTYIAGMSREKQAKYLKKLTDKGYFCELLVTSPHSGLARGHAVALDSVSGNDVFILDPGFGDRGVNNLYSRYSKANYVVWFKYSKIKNGLNVSYNNNQYRVSDKKKKTVELVKGDAHKADVIIPSTITINKKKYKVTAVADGAFEKNNSVEQITIGKNITSIGSHAFADCSNLQQINIKTIKLDINLIDKKAFCNLNENVVVLMPSTVRDQYAVLFGDDADEAELANKQ